MIAGSLPLLTGLEVLHKGNAEIRFREKTLAYIGHVVPISVNRDGHLAIDIAPTDDDVARSQASAHLHRAGCPGKRGPNGESRAYYAAEVYIGSVL